MNWTLKAPLLTVSLTVSPRWAVNPVWGRVTWLHFLCQNHTLFMCRWRSAVGRGKSDWRPRWSVLYHLPTLVTWRADPMVGVWMLGWACEFIRLNIAYGITLASVCEVKVRFCADVSVRGMCRWRSCVTPHVCLHCPCCLPGCSMMDSYSWESKAQMKARPGAGWALGQTLFHKSDVWMDVLEGEYL